MITDSGGGGAGASPKAVYRNHIGAASGNAAGNGGDVVDGGYFYYDRFFIFCGFFQRKYKLPEIFNGINIMVGSRGNSIRAFWYHPGTGDVSHNFCAGKVSADPGLGALPHFYLDGGPGV